MPSGIKLEASVGMPVDTVSVDSSVSVSVSVGMRASKQASKQASK